MPPLTDFPLALAPYIPRVVVTVALAAFALALARAGRRLVARYVDEPAKRYTSYKIIGRVTGLVLVVAFVLLWAPVRRDMLTILTVIGTGIAISTREALLSVVGWLHLIIRSPYKHGDRIEVHGVRGDVVDVRLLHTTLVEVGGWVDGDQSTGRLVHFPNNWVFLHPIVNSTHGFGFVWSELPFTLTQASDWEAAQRILEGLAAEAAGSVEARARAAIDRLSHEFLVQYSILTPFVYVKATPEGIRLTLRYLCEVRRRRGTDHAFTVSALAAFGRHGGIALAEA